MIAPVVAAAAAAMAPAAATLPLAIAPTGHATVDVTIEGIGTHPFVLDTGAEETVVYRGAAEAWRLPLAREGTTLVGQTGASEVPIAPLPPLTMGPIRREGLRAAVLPPRGDGVPLAGIVGLDVFGGGVLAFDWPRRAAALLPAVPAGLARRPAIAVTRTTGRLLTIPVAIGGITATAVIDTGARKTRINWALGRRLGLSPEALPAGDRITGATNALFETRAATVRGVRLGGVAIGARPVLVGDLPVFGHFGVADRPAAILGLDWLDGVRMTIDFPADRVWFERSAA